MTTQRWKLTVEYDGGPFNGWQRQEDGVPSVQAALEDAVYSYCQQRTTVHVAGRTDAGVHACGQVCHVDLPVSPITPFALAKALTAILFPKPVAVLKAEKISDDFHARFAAKNKLYTYRLIRRSAFLTIDRGRAWHLKRDLDAQAMQNAAKYLLGKHDFSTFRDSHCQAKSPLKTLDRLDIDHGAYDSFGGTEIRIHAEARSFLHHMVRNIVGSLTLVGDGKWQPADMKLALEARDRTKGGPTAPAEGLYLMRVDY